MTRPLQNIVVFLNGDRGIEVVESVIESGKNVAAIVAPQGSKFWADKHKDIAFENCKFFKRDDINSLDFLKKIKALNSDLFLVAGFSTIFKSDILSVPSYGVLNLHGGALPQYRGGSPINWQIINDEPQITVSVIKMAEGIDAGDILGEESFPYNDKENIHHVHQKANKAFIRIVNSVLDQIEDGSVVPRVQNEADAIYWMQRNTKEGLIDWKTMTARQVFNLVRALAPPYPGAFTFEEGKKINVLKVKEVDKIIRGTPGRVAYIEGEGPYIVCSNRAILVLESSEKIKNGALLR